jgi:hypothetical protein
MIHHDDEIKEAVSILNDSLKYKSTLKKK